jgi:HEAT repeat protein
MELEVVIMSRPYLHLILWLVVSAFLADSRSPAVRLYCASPQPAAPGRDLLKDPSPSVRLRAALVLAEAGDAEAVPVLIDLLADLPAEQRRPVEAVLTRLAGEWAPVLEFPRDDEVSRGIRRDAWAGWWRRTDGVLLLATLGKHSLTADKRERVRRLIGRLGDEEYAVRESAGQELAALGRVALPQLREATKDRDPEVARRAAKLINRIVRQPSQQLPVTVFRLLAMRKPPGSVEALLAYLPIAEEDQRTEEVRQTLGRLALCDGRPNPALLRALSDTRPAWRSAAAVALSEDGGKAGRIAARKLLGDKAPGVRLHVALALARAGESEAVLVLINLLAVLPAEEAWQVEDILSVLAADTPPQVPAGDKPDERKKRRDAWAAWWKANADRTDLARLNDLPLLGYTLVCDTAGRNRVFEIDRQGKERWAIANVADPVDLVVLPGQRILIAEYGANRITERDLQGKILWEKKVGKPCNVQRLANGNTWIALEGGALLEVDRTGKEVWTIPRVPGGVRAARRSPRGDIICLTQNEQCLLLDATGKQLGSFAATGHGENSQGCLDMLANGHILITCSKIGKVMEFDRKGKKRLEWDVPDVLTASALPNGHILAACQGTHRVCELDRAGKVVWEYKNAGNPHRARRR